MKCSALGLVSFASVFFRAPPSIDPCGLELTALAYFVGLQFTMAAFVCIFVAVQLMFEYRCVLLPRPLPVTNNRPHYLGKRRCAGGFSVDVNRRATLN